MTVTRTVFDIETGEIRVEEVSPEEAAPFEEAHAQMVKRAEEIDEQEAIQASLVELARVKLIGLGLSEEEVEAIVGPEPKVIDEDITNLDPATLEPAVEEPVVEPVADPVVEDEAAE